MRIRLSATAGKVIAAILLIFMCESTFAGNRKWITANDKYASITKETGPFTSIKILGSIHLKVTQTTGERKVEIYGPDNIVPLVATNRMGSTLWVRLKTSSSVRLDGKTLEVRVYMPNIKSLSINGSGNIILPGEIKSAGEISLNVAGSGRLTGSKVKCGKLNIATSGSGDLFLKTAEASEIKAKVSGSGNMDVYEIKSVSISGTLGGSGNIRFSGKTVNANYRVAGSGTIMASDLKAQFVKARTSGSGDIDCYASEKIEGSSIGSGSIIYKGKPKYASVKNK
ncbi:MAG: DUF2807 domain-containing protein [Bacteroidales bacterium]|jgi:hypothetical protein|nr:DUF2807 domain-containing protein [Bacteroidales bacterium]